MAKQNFLLGRGERLTEDVTVRSGGGAKQAPYTFFEARSRLTPMLGLAVKEVDALPADACPRDEAVLSLTLNPEYIAKSYFPADLLREVGIEVVGSRPKKVKPEKRSRDREPTETITTELFARGTRSAFRRWSQALPDWSLERSSADELVSIEAIAAPAPWTKIKGVLPEEGVLPLEIVLHAAELEGEVDALEEFGSFLEARKLSRTFGRRFYAQGLCFLELDAPTERAEEIATFSSVRALRKMPELRVLRPTIRSSGIPSTAPTLPTGPAISEETRVAIFDGGVPEGHALTEWVTPYELEGMLPATEELYEHGVAVTSAALFGHIDPKKPIPRPFAAIDHYRVLDEDPHQDLHELYQVLERIEGVLASQEYDFINLSIGPCLPIEDDDVHAWTAVLDDRLARTSTLAAVAVGNDGESDSATGLDRVQVPSDCVNALAVGACDTPEAGWARAPYSSVGPGRSPGLIKPDLVGFGGSVTRPFVVLSHELAPKLTTTGGTSFATPSVVRMASGVRAHFGANLNHLAIRSLLVHTAEVSEHDPREVGWGRCAQDLNDIVLCADDEVRVVYQGEISPAKYIRASIPVPTGEIKSMVNLKATICYKSQTDPHHPGNYTRAGLEVTFRPHDERFTREGQLHPDSKSFFGSSPTGATEDELRRDAWKWENCLHASRRMQGRSLCNPVFDIHYNARLEGRNFAPSQKLPYALVVSVQARGVADFYDQIVRKYAARLEPLRPVLEVPVRT
ncbi:S8 family peptidase [Rhodobacter capsulatus]|uniref:S8 family peptidase n=1 Tax=Rhodobacter capsulatus TaxID=1061 RepID=UPI0003D38779|nr:S8 family peptidase [Rhodobacter capsulatus]ETD85433.1 peptidase S8 and S53, subtilisin, kexin, sedolisin [Rhodobacter capsulatus YW1]